MGCIYSMPKIRSRTKKSVARADLLKIIMHHFGKNTQVGKIKELDDGYYSIAYDIEITNLEYNIVIKFAPPSLKHQLIYEQKGIDTEVAFIKLLQERSSREKLPYPDLLFYELYGKTVGRAYFIMKKFEGPSWNKKRKELTEEQNNLLYTQIGNIQKEINTIKGECFGSVVTYDDFPIDKQTWGDTVLEMFRNLLRDSKRFRTGLTRKKKKILETIKNCFPFLNEVKEPQLVHWDLWEGNVFLTQEDEGWTIEGIIDFERALWGDPLMEMIFRKWWRKEPFVQSYGEEILQQPGAEIRDRIYSLYLFMIFIIESSARNYRLAMKIGFKFIGWRYFRKNLKWIRKKLNKDLLLSY